MNRRVLFQMTSPQADEVRNEPSVTFSASIDKLRDVTSNKAHIVDDDGGLRVGVHFTTVTDPEPNATTT